MGSLLDIDITSVTTLTAERSVRVIRAILRAEIRYAGLGPDALTISSRITTADGGIDAEVNCSASYVIPTDCLFNGGLTGIQIKSGSSFKPWTDSSIRAELVDSTGELYSEVKRLVQRGGTYQLLCTGHDLTPEQRNEALSRIAAVLATKGFPDYEAKICILGASQIAEYAERYPSTVAMLALDPIQEGHVVDVWQRDAHMANQFEASPEQSGLIETIRAGLLGDAKHIRLLGEPGLGKTRLVLESVKHEAISPYTLYIPFGSDFGKTKLFRQILRDGRDKPLVLVMDELPEAELADIWRSFKIICGQLRLITIDHGRDETYDADIIRIEAPRLPDTTIKRILSTQVGESFELDRWVGICEGSPRVAQAVAENLVANPDDLLKPPSTIPIWSRFIHGYRVRDDEVARQIDCVTQHLALFSRFGYEAPVTDEARYIAALIQKVDPTIGWARFQEIVEGLRAKRVLQGKRTLLFVPKALHIHLWKRFWQQYGRAFDVEAILQGMPPTLNVWFMSRFRFAADTAASAVVGQLLEPSGPLAKPEVIVSPAGSRFISILAEASPQGVLRLLESTIGLWPSDELIEFRGNRQNIIVALEKIAVWSPWTVRAMNLLARLAVCENSSYGNNATGTFVGLCNIGPDYAGTEASPTERLPALLHLLRGDTDEERRLALKAMGAALNDHPHLQRTVGAEFQGMRERANFWKPGTYQQWWDTVLTYFTALLDETRNWPSSMHVDVCDALLEAVRYRVATPTCTELALRTLEELTVNPAMSKQKLNRFFGHRREYLDRLNTSEYIFRLREIERRYTKQSVGTRFQRYIIDAEYLDWYETTAGRRKESTDRAKKLVDGLARRVSKKPECFAEIAPLVVPTDSPALEFFGQRLAYWDSSRQLLRPLLDAALKSHDCACVIGYLSTIRITAAEFFRTTVVSLLHVEATAWLGATIALASEYDDDLFGHVLHAFRHKWIQPRLFSLLRYRKSLESVPHQRLVDLLQQLDNEGTRASQIVLLEYLDAIPFDDTCPFDARFVTRALAKAAMGPDHVGASWAYKWKVVCEKLIVWDETQAVPVLNSLLEAMNDEYELAYDQVIVPLIEDLCRRNPLDAWNSIRKHLEDAMPEYRHDILRWLKGSTSAFDRPVKPGVSCLPVERIIQWVDEDAEHRAALIAGAAPATLDRELGGDLTRLLLHRYSRFDGVKEHIQSTFNSGAWSGPTSLHLRKQRDQLRKWLGSGFEMEVTHWIESQIEFLDRQIEHEEITEERTFYE